jgi:PsbP
LDEINFAGTRSGYQYGITVDPVRIDSLADFGTPAQVAAKVVLAELNRDGVLDVTLMEDALARDEYYQVNYLSSGKRGKKRFVAKFFIDRQKLYALTAQCKEEDYNELSSEILAAVSTFNVLH